MQEEGTRSSSKPVVRVHTSKTRISKLWWNASRNTPVPESRWLSRAKKSILSLGCGQKHSPGCHLSTAQLEEFMQVVPNSGTASWQITTNIYSCLSVSADLTLKWMGSQHFFHFVKAGCVRTCLCQHVHTGAGTEGGQQPCWLPQIFLQLWFDQYTLRVKDNTAVKRKCSFQTPPI